MTGATKSKILGVLSVAGAIIVWGGVYWFFHRSDEYAIWRLFGFEPVITKRICQIESPEGISSFSEYWDDRNKVVRVEVERLWDHQKKSGNMSADDYKKLWDQLKEHVVPGSEKEVILNP